MAVGAGVTQRPEPEATEIGARSQSGMDGHDAHELKDYDRDSNRDVELEAVPTVATRDTRTDASGHISDVDMEAGQTIGEMDEPAGHFDEINAESRGSDQGGRAASGGARSEALTEVGGQGLGDFFGFVHSAAGGPSVQLASRCVPALSRACSCGDCWCMRDGGGWLRAAPQPWTLFWECLRSGADSWFQTGLRLLSLLGCRGSRT